MAIEAEEQSLSELEREAERTRAGLIHTVDELHSRVSPQAIKQEMRSYAREAGQDLMHNLQQRAKENPLQTVAVAAGLAYPAWRFIANIPAPILLIGAGLAVSQAGARSPKGMSRDQGTATDGRTVQYASSHVREAAASARSRVTELSERAGAAVSDAAASARNTAAESLAAVRETVSGSYQASVQAVAGTGEQLSERLSGSKETLTEMMENHPFVVGGIGLLVGALIASVLPVSQAENRILGDSSDAVKNRARDVASEGVNIAAATAQSVYEESASRVQEQGLSSESVRGIVKNVGEKVKEAAHQAADAMTKQNDPSPAR
jgi:hypothetical protein